MTSELSDIFKIDSEITRLKEERKKTNEQIVRNSKYLVLAFLELKSRKDDIESDIPDRILSQIRSRLQTLLKNPSITEQIAARLHHVRVDEE